MFRELLVCGGVGEVDIECFGDVGGGINQARAEVFIGWNNEEVKTRHKLAEGSFLKREQVFCSSSGFFEEARDGGVEVMAAIVEFRRDFPVERPPA